MPEHAAACQRHHVHHRCRHDDDHSRANYHLEASTSTSTTTTTRAATNTSISATSTTTPIYEPPIVSDTSPTTTLPRSPDTIPARPEVEPDPVFIASDGDVEAVIQVVDSNEVPSQLSVQEGSCSPSTSS